jgi:RNA polymerase sigma-70 factor (ECF subfamily)
VDVDRLVRLAQGGDDEAFGALYDAYAERVYRFLLFRVAQPADAEDLLQQVFLKVIESLPRYEQRGLPFGAWLFRIARNAAIDFGRTRPVTGRLDDPGALVADHEGPAQLVERAADLEALRVALDELPTEQRDVIVYRFFAGLSHGEIAALVGKREGTVRVIQHRALAVLRHRIADPRRLSALPDEA